MTENKDIINMIQEHLACPRITIITDRKGKILECSITESIGEIVELSELTYIASLVAVRHDVAHFHSVLEGLQMTINIFKNVFVLTTLLNEKKLFIIIVPKSTNLLDLISLGEDVKSIHGFLADQIIKI